MLPFPIPAAGVQCSMGATLPDPDDTSRGEEWDAAVQLIERWGARFGSREDAEEYLAAARCLVGTPGPRAKEALQAAMARLEEVFRRLLFHGDYILRPSMHLDSSSSSHTAGGDDSADSGGKISFFYHDTISPYTAPTLRDIADVMLRAGYAPQLCQVYIKVRRYWLIAALGIRKMSMEEVQLLKWGELDGKMKQWIQKLKVFVRVHLAEERRICSQIFAAHANVEEECFIEVAKGCVLHILNFGDAIAMGKRSPQKLCGILEMYEALGEVLPELEGLFSGETRDFIKGEAEGILVRLGDSVRDTITKFSSVIQGEGEASWTQLPGVEMHPMTCYVMYYILLLAEYNASLNNLLEFYADKGDDNMNMTPLGRCVLMLITHLQEKIEEHSSLYKDQALQYIFFMNNILYIVQMVKNSKLKTLLGDNWILQTSGQIRQYSKGYLQSSWTRVLACLRDDGLPQKTGSSSALDAALKDRFKIFNLAFEELYRTQTSWTVVDKELREELNISISENVLPAYRSFVGRFGGQLEGGGSSATYIKYSPEDLENLFSDFFEGRKLDA